MTLQNKDLYALIPHVGYYQILGKSCVTLTLYDFSELKHYRYELELNKSDLHKTWGVLRVIIGNDANNLKPKLQFQVNDKYVTDSLEIANSFNEIFVSIGPKLADNILSTTNPLSYVNCTNSIVIPPVTIAEVSQTILSMKNSSAGWDDFPARIAKQ